MRPAADAPSGRPESNRSLIVPLTNAMKTIAVCAFTGADIAARGRTIDYNAFFRFP